MRCDTAQTKAGPRGATHGLWVGGVEDEVDDPLRLNLSLGIGLAGEQPSSLFLFKQCLSLIYTCQPGSAPLPPILPPHTPPTPPHPAPSTPLALLFPSPSSSTIQATLNSLKGRYGFCGTVAES